jgi:hypothetical protein
MKPQTSTDSALAGCSQMRVSGWYLLLMVSGSQMVAIEEFSFYTSDLGDLYCL